MCNLYNITTSQNAIREWTRAMRDIMGNLEPSLDVYPNMPGAVVRNASASLPSCFGACLRRQSG